MKFLQAGYGYSLIAIGISFIWKSMGGFLEQNCFYRFLMDFSWRQRDSCQRCTRCFENEMPLDKALLIQVCYIFEWENFQILPELLCKTLKGIKSCQVSFRMQMWIRPWNERGSVKCWRLHTHLKTSAGSVFQAPSSSNMFPINDLQWWFVNVFEMKN